MRFRLRRNVRPSPSEAPAAPSDPTFNPISKDMVSQLSAVLIKIVGESVRGKVLRAALIGGISAATFYATDPGPPVVSDPTPAPPAVVATHQ